MSNTAKSLEPAFQGVGQKAYPQLERQCLLFIIIFFTTPYLMICASLFYHLFVVNYTYLVKT